MIAMSTFERRSHRKAAVVSTSNSVGGPWRRSTRSAALSTSASTASRFDASIAHRVREAVWHRSQELTELDGGGLELAVTVAGIIEIRPWILSWGEGVEVLEPASLREAVATAVRTAAARYAD